ncbi:39S ribosomal protein L50, mitochondrial [Condylostylus longicornis]|uniref:39S ribosomal protein L50, mitochondrial n=1 Tax=Condylostylus longicornis TaxID=2530218 RepID=UPI00244DE5BB|nr:39S ribosomal protein L50, mitochondrial [Condylostylus longicornis]
MITTASIRRLAFTESRRFYAKKAKNQPAVQKKIESVASSIASRGFLRSIKSYEPPENVAEKIKQITSQTQIESITNIDNKFKLLSACFEEFKHSVPNSALHEIETIDDIIKFYETPVDTTVPYDALQKMDLPENLHIQSDYLRFNPETDNMFNGQTAFPKSSTLVTGLKYRNKYPGYAAKRSWP